MEIYVVKTGDTVDIIADLYQVAAVDIIYANQLTPPYPLAVGQALLIPDGNQAAEKIPARINGYAYPYINPWVLEQTLPYLTELSVFSYGFTPEGELIPPALSVDFMIEAAGRHSVLPILTLTPFGADGQFNNYLIHTVVQSEEAVDALIANLQAAVEEYGYAGVDVDFEYILAEDRDAFTAFVARLTEAMHSIGRQVSVALAPKQSANQQGLLYEGKDYAGLGAAADYVLLMTYEWGYTYGPPMAVAPLNQVRRVVEYGASAIPAEKIMMGLPNYGYDWILPFQRGITRATAIGNQYAVEIAQRRGVPITFDETAYSPTFSYWGSQRLRHVVWFEDVRSIQGKFDLMDEFSLRGGGYWNVMRPFNQNWAFAAARYQIRKEV